MKFLYILIGIALVLKSAIAVSTFTIQVTGGNGSLYGRQATSKSGQSYPLWLQSPSDESYDFNSLTSFIIDPDTGHLYTADGTNILTMYVRNNNSPYPLTLALPEDPNTRPLKCSLDVNQVLTCTSMYKGIQYSNFFGNYPLGLGETSADALSLEAVPGQDSPAVDLGGCNYQLINETEGPPNTVCGVSGNVSDPATLGESQPAATANDCLQSCGSQKMCQSFSYDSTSQTCQLYAKRVKNMSFRKSNMSDTIFYSRLCFQKVCPTPPAKSPLCRLGGRGNYTLIAIPQNSACPGCVITNPFGSLGDVDLLVEDYDHADKFNGQWLLIHQLQDTWAIQNRVSGKYMTVGSGNGSDVYQTALDGGSHQLFFFALSQCRFFSVEDENFNIVIYNSGEGSNVVSGGDDWEPPYPFVYVARLY